MKFKAPNGKVVEVKDKNHESVFVRAGFKPVTTEKK